MDNIKNDRYFLQRIFKDLNFIISHTHNIRYDDFCADELLLDSVMFRLIQISENSYKLSESFKNNYASIPWLAIKGMRNRIVHDYGNVDYMVIYNTVIKDIPELLLMLKETFGE